MILPLLPFPPRVFPHFPPLLCDQWDVTAPAHFSCHRHHRWRAHKKRHVRARLDHLEWRADERHRLTPFPLPLIPCPLRVYLSLSSLFSWAKFAHSLFSRLVSIIGLGKGDSRERETNESRTRMCASPSHKCRRKLSTLLSSGARETALRT